MTKDYYKNYDNTGLQKFEITAIYTNATDFIKEIRGATEYCQYIYLDDEKNIIIELNENKRKMDKESRKNISNELEKQMKMNCIKYRFRMIIPKLIVR